LKPVESEIRQRFVQFLESKEFKPFLKRLERPPIWRYVAGFLAFMTTVGIPFTLYQAYRILTHRKRRRRELIAWAKGAVPVMTYGLMHNTALGSRPGVVAPGLVIGSFDPEANVTTEYMVDLAEKIFELSLAEPTTPEERQIHELMSDMAYVEDRRRLLPRGLTGGREVYAFDLMMVGDYQPNGVVETPLFPCLADPGPEGEIRMIPWWVVTGEPAPART
jgi:hypothetical protein